MSVCRYICLFVCLSVHFYVANASTARKARIEVNILKAYFYVIRQTFICLNYGKIAKSSYRKKLNDRKKKQNAAVKFSLIFNYFNWAVQNVSRPKSASRKKIACKKKVAKSRKNALKCVRHLAIDKKNWKLMPMKMAWFFVNFHYL